MTLSRRQVLATTGALATPAVLAGCAGFKPGGTSGSGGGSGTELTFTTWGTDAELTGFRKAISSFQASHKGVTVRLNAVPYAQMFTNIDAQLAAGNPPDVFRVPYYSFGGYAGRGQLLDLTGHLPSDAAQRFTPQAWAAVQRDGRPHGVPHHTDTSVILYDTTALSDAGITSVPQRIEDAWTWEELGQVATKLRASLPDDRYPMAVNWQGNGVTRWLTWLWEADGALLQGDQRTPAIDSAAGRAAADLTAGFFTKRWVPANDSVKSTTYASDTWFAKTVPMVFAGAFLLPDAAKTYGSGWSATYAPRGRRAASDFGGNALVATAGTTHPDDAAAFLDHLTSRDAMRDFCTGASLLPTRRDLSAEGLTFTVRPELSHVFVEQARTVRATDSAQVASPHMAKVITVLKDQLEQAFTGHQASAATVTAIADGIRAAAR